MTVTLDSKSLNVSGFREPCKAVYVIKDKWENEAFKRKVKVLGALKTWLLECYEEGVTWTASAAKHFQTKIAAGDSVTFVVSEADMHAVNLSVFIVECAIVYPKGVKKETKYRKFTLKLVEAQ